LIEGSTEDFFNFIEALTKGAGLDTNGSTDDVSIHVKGNAGVGTSNEKCCGTKLLLAKGRCPPKSTLGLR
jgi:hypothetical protein